MKRLLAFIRRDARESRSYLGSWVVDGSGVLLTVLTFYFLGRWIDQGAGREWSLARPAQSYFGFAVNGIAMASLLLQVVRGHAVAIRHAQVTGTLEPMLLAPLPAWRVAVGGALSNLFKGMLRLVLYLGLAAILGGLTLHARLLWLPLVICLAALGFVPFGLLAASYTVAFKRGDPISHLVNAATLLLAGVYFPAAVLPSWLQPVSAIYPVTHAVTALRNVTLGAGHPFEPLVALTAFTVVALPASIWLFERSVAHARKVGSLGHM